MQDSFPTNALSKPENRPENRDVFSDFQPDAAPQEAHAYCQAAKNYVQTLRAAQTAALSADFPVTAWVKHYSSQIDRILQGLHQRYAQRQALTLIAIGGYGRAELFPQSDIDLLILCPTGEQAAAEGFVQLLWQLGLDIAHNVRSPSECLHDCQQEQAQHFPFLTALLEQRFLCGDRALAKQIQIQAPLLTQKTTFLAAKLAEQKQRDARQLSLGRLEPNLKTDPGGLRDIHMIGWIQHYCLGQSEWQALLSAEECQLLSKSRRILWQIRFSLHLRSKRPKDILSFEAQKQLATQFGFSGEAHLAIQSFMRLYYLSALHVRRLNRLAIKLCDETLNSPVQIQALDEHFTLRNNRLALNNSDILRHNPAFVWQIFLRLLEHPSIDSLSPQLTRQLRQHSQTYQHQPSNEAAHRAFLAILSHDGNLYREIRRIHRYGLLSHYLPPFAQLIGQMQYDLFHEYTVDQHSLRLFYFLDSFKQGNPAYPEAQLIMQRIKRPAILYLAALLHDIGKGRAGEHCQIGADITAQYAKHNPCLSPKERDLLIFLVRHHLQLSLTAQKKDLSNPDIIAQFAALFPSSDYLDHLYLLTLADISATHNKLWNSWKAELMHSLYRLTHDYLSNQALQANSPNTQVQKRQQQSLAIADSAQHPALKQLWAQLPNAFFSNQSPRIILAKSQILRQYPEQDFAAQLPSEAPRLFIGALNSPDIVFARVSHFLEKHGFTIVEARLYREHSGERRVLQEYRLANQSQLSPDILKNLRRTISANLAPQAPKPRLHNPALQHFSAHPQIHFRHHPHYSEMELICKDRHGLLSLISRTLLEHHIHLSHAKIATFGERVEDNFYLSDRQGKALSPSAAEALRQDLIQLLE